MITTGAFFNLSSTNRRKRRQKNRAANKAKAEIPLIVPSSTTQKHQNSSPQKKYDSEINFATTNLKLPPKLQFFLDNEIKRASDLTVHLLMKLYAILNAETGKLEEYRTLLKSVNKILCEKGCSKEVVRLAQGRAANMSQSKVPKHSTLLMQIN